MKNKPTIFCFGEVLWDVFPEGKKIGGAPLNVALRLLSYGYAPKIISAVGDDDEGHEIRAYFNKNGLSQEFLQKDKTLPTGKVKVEIDPEGIASYDIITPVAWDNIEVNTSLEDALAQSDLFLFGSLAARSKASKNTLHTFLENAKFKVFDVNLRPPFYSHSHLMDLMLAADFIKFNTEELTEVCNYLGGKDNDYEGQLKFISDTTHTDQICVTLGADGAILYLHGKVYKQKGYKVNVQDTVGAGDSFLATLLDGILQQEAPEKTLQKACAVGALVSSKAGANPSITEAEIRQLISSTLA